MLADHRFAMAKRALRAANRLRKPNAALVFHPVKTIFKGKYAHNEPGAPPAGGERAMQTPAWQGPLASKAAKASARTRADR